MTTAREVIDSLTGFEELAIEKATGAAVEIWSDQGRDLVLTRALAAVINARETYDGKDKPATPALINSTINAEYQKIQAMPQRDVAKIFEDDPVEVFEDEPVTEPGKDSAHSINGHTTSQSSASQPA